MTTYGDIHVADTVAAALKAGMSESTVESQHLRAIAVLTATTAQNPAHATALTSAIALLNRSLSHLRNPLSTDV